MIELLTDPQAWIAFLTLTALELVLGIDNVVFISILVDKLPPGQRLLAWRIGLALAMVMRLALLFTLTWLAGLTQPLFHLFTQGISGRDLILIGGGVFLLWKSTHEIHGLLEGQEHGTTAVVTGSFAGAIVQIILVDAVFSLDSIITAIGLVNQLPVMIAAIVVSIALMMVFAGMIGRVVSSHPTLKMLALSFLFVIAVLLVAEGFEHHVPKGYVYFAMAFSVAVEMLNIRVRKRAPAPVHLRRSYERAEARSDQRPT